MGDYDPRDPVAPFPPRAVDVEPGFERFQSLITPEELKAQYLFGIPLRSSLTKGPDGKPEEMSVETIKAFITRAISQIEHEVRIVLSPVKYEERFDYQLADYRNYNFIQLHHWPVLQVESVKAKYPNSVDFIQYPNEWISIYNEFGMLQLTPTTGSLTQFFMTNDASYIPLLLGSRLSWPQLWQVTYTAGFAQDKLPAIMNDLIATIASIDILVVVGPVLFPYMGYGVGLDGVSQSISGPGPQLFTERIASLKEKRAQLTDIVKRHYNHQLHLGVL